MKLEPLKLRRWVRRACIAAFLVTCVLLWRNYGWMSVPSGMTTMPDAAPPGALCLVEKSPRTFVPGRSVVFVRSPMGALVVTRVIEVIGEHSVVVGHDNRQVSVGLEGAASRVPVEAIEGLVLTVLSGN